MYCSLTVQIRKIGFYILVPNKILFLKKINKKLKLFLKDNYVLGSV